MTQHIETEANPASLVSQADRLVSDALRTYRQPDAYTRLARFHGDQAAIDWGTVWGADQPSDSTILQAPRMPFPVLLRKIEQLARKVEALQIVTAGDRKSTRLNSSHVAISYAVFCLKKKT